MGDAISSLLFQPPPPTYLHPSRHFWLTTELGSGIPAFFIDRRASTTILFSHGNAEDLGMIYDWFVDLARVLRVNILAYDYTGYGKSSKSVPSETDCYADIQAAYRYLTVTKQIPASQIVLYGRSLGSGPSCFLARQTARQGQSVGGVILQSPLLSAYRVAFDFRFTFPGDRFPNVEYARDIRCPVLVVHGTQDEVVPFWHGQELWQCVPQDYRAKPFWVHGAGHNNIEALLRSNGGFVRALHEYLVHHVGHDDQQIRTVPACMKELQERREENEGTAVLEVGA